LGGFCYGCKDWRACSEIELFAYWQCCSQPDYERYGWKNTGSADYTIAYFWDPTCGHCKTVTPKVKEFYDKFKDELGIEVYGVNTNAKEHDEWIKYINEHNLDWINVEDPEQKTAYKYLYDIYSTPVIYLLDKDKKMIAKRIGAEDLENFIRHHKKKSS
jgi:thiol-disulfide isomerase/thioredoxin